MNKIFFAMCFEGKLYKLVIFKDYTNLNPLNDRS